MDVGFMLYFVSFFRSLCCVCRTRTAARHSAATTCLAYARRVRGRPGFHQNKKLQPTRAPPFPLVPLA